MSRFNDWLQSDKALREAQKEQKRTLSLLIDSIISEAGPWPNEQEDSVFITMDSEHCEMLLELLPFDYPHHAVLPFRLHTMQKVKS